MAANERTSLLRAHENGENGWQKLQKPGKLIIQMPKDQVFEYEHDFSAALSLEELLPYQDDLWWQKLRSTIFYSFWFAVLLTLFTACSLAYLHGHSSCKNLKPMIGESIASTLATPSFINDINGKLAVLAT